jgi:hypothetical protein
MAKKGKIEGPIHLEMVSGLSGERNVDYDYETQYCSRLGKEVRISPKAMASINKPGFKVEFFTETVTVCVNIGENHCADLIMTKSAWEALKSGEQQNAITISEFKRSYLQER